VKLKKRLFLILPFIATAITYLIWFWKEEGCIPYFNINPIKSVFWILLFLTFIVGLVATIYKTNSGIWLPRAEPISFMLLLICFIILLEFQFNSEIFKSERVFTADCNRSSAIKHSLYLVFRKDETLDICLMGSISICNYTGSYKIKSDSIFFDDKTVAKAKYLLAPVYLFRDSILLPQSLDTEKQANYVVLKVNRK
jgi:hypothetical protein